MMRVARMTATVQQGVGPLLCRRLVWYNDEVQRAETVDGNLTLWVSSVLMRLRLAHLSSLSPDHEARVRFMLGTRLDSVGALPFKEAGIAYRDAIRAFDAHLQQWGRRFMTPMHLGESFDAIWQGLPQEVKKDKAKEALLRISWQDAVQAADRLTQVETEYFGLD